MTRSLSNPCHEAWASHLHDLWTSDPAEVHRVLDLGCGTGLVAAALIAYGYRVTGVDSSPTMLARARRLLGPEAVLIQRAMPGLGVDGVFDAVISTFDALNYLPTSELGATVVAAACRLRPEGLAGLRPAHHGEVELHDGEPGRHRDGGRAALDHQQRRGSRRPHL
jgi:SAM-dependent methyltransferase